MAPDFEEPSSMEVRDLSAAVCCFGLDWATRDRGGCAHSMRLLARLYEFEAGQRVMRVERLRVRSKKPSKPAGCRIGAALSVATVSDDPDQLSPTRLGAGQVLAPVGQ